MAINANLSRQKELKIITEEKNVHKLTPEERAAFFEIEKAVNEIEESYFGFHSMDSKEYKSEVKKEVTWKILRQYYEMLEDILDWTIPFFVKSRLVARRVTPTMWD